jgi:2-oxoglutarate/2-oxoacid ferredoxin oxidoreductase subunit alpha
MDRLARKHKAAAAFVPLPRTRYQPEAQFGVISIGGCDPAVAEALDLLQDRGVYADYMRICGFPFHKSVEEFLYSHDRCFIVEQNRDAQLRSLLTLETCVPKNRLRSILAYSGFPLSARYVVDGIISQLESDSAIHS